MWLAEESHNHNTVDTLAKKLFLNNEYEKLKELKITLSLFFIIKQFLDDKINPRHVTNKKPNIHYRYISLVSAFLEKQAENIVLPGNIKFITWNYDIQLELALGYFLSKQISCFEDIQGRFKSYPSSNEEIAPSIVHLNGIAGLYSQGETLNCIYNQIHHSNLSGLLENILPFYEMINEQTDSQYDPVHSFTYSWENNDVARKAIINARNIMKNTQYLVIIGYSFPVFNRTIDRTMFGSLERLQKIYYQDPNANAQSLSTTFNIPVNIVHEIDNVDQFFLPFEF